MNDRNTTIWLMESTKARLDKHFEGRESYNDVLNRVLEKAKSHETIKLLGNAMLKEISAMASSLLPIMDVKFSTEQAKVLQPALQKVMASFKRIQALVKNPPKAETKEFLSETFGEYMRELQKTHPEYFKFKREGEK